MWDIFFLYAAIYKKNENYEKIKTQGWFPGIHLHLVIFSIFSIEYLYSYGMKCKNAKMPKNKSLGLNGTEPGVKWNIILICNGLIIFTN
jgi:hypothetical protein